jgi:aldose 1-epimerase
MTDHNVNSPEWGRKEAEITGPDETYKWDSAWTFTKL